MDLVVHGPRDLESSLSDPSNPDSTDEVGDETPAVIVACPPHPQFGGNRRDPRLVAVSDRLLDAGIACLRFDYGEWDEGYGERSDARSAVRWVRERYDRVGIFGYSFGGTIAVLAAADGPGVDACASLAPGSRIDDELDAVTALDHIDCPYLVVYGTRDTTADWEPIVDCARTVGHRVEPFPGDHHFVGQRETVAVILADFFAEVLV